MLISLGQWVIYVKYNINKRKSRKAHPGLRSGCQERNRDDGDDDAYSG